MSDYGWTVDEQSLSPLAAAADPAVRDGAISVAATVLWALSGRQFGLFPTTVRPCLQTPDWRRGVVGGVGAYLIVSWEGSGWANIACGCGAQCRESGPRAAHLPGPVSEVLEVTLGNDLLDPSGYRLENNTLYRVGANWPLQDLNRPAGEAGTWTVTYLRGQPVPPGVDRFTALLASEILNALSGAQCRLPRNVTTTTRNGVSYQVYDPSVMYANGKTGLIEIDMWLAAVNPRHLQQPPQVI